MNLQVRKSTLLLGGALGIFLFALLKRKRGPKKVGSVLELVIYPLKSAKGNSHKTVVAAKTGLQGQSDGLVDRTFAIRRADDNTKISGRECPKLVLVSVRRIEDHLVVSAPGMEHDLRIPVESAGKEAKLELFGTWIECQEGSEEASQWFSKYLEIDVKLSINATGRFLRDKKEDWARTWRLEGVQKDENEVAFADGAPILMLSTQSLADVNSKIQRKSYTMKTFRPNMIISTESGRPWEEDDWCGKLQIGEAILAVSSPCPRCIFTTIDPETATRDKELEPLKSLRKFRMSKGKDAEYGIDSPLVGVNVVIIKQGKISVGDDIILLSE